MPLKRIAKFEKVSFLEYKKDMEGFKLPEKLLQEMYDNITLPARATAGSAGYDFKLPFGINLIPGEDLSIPTGIRCKMDEGWVLNIFPRSGLGFKYQMRLANTVGIIDSDYYNAENEGHIIIKIVNGGSKDIVLESGKGFAQGIFFEYGITVDDAVTDTRTGGFGSTNK